MYKVLLCNCVIIKLIFLSILLQRIVQQRVLPALSSEFRNNKMIPFVLPLVLLIAEDCTLQEYCTLIMPVITPALHMQDPIQVHVYMYMYNVMYVYIYMCLTLCMCTCMYNVVSTYGCLF